MSRGKGVVDFTNYLSGNRPQFLSLVMKRFGDLPIVEITLYRKPVSGMLQKIFNWTNKGQWEQEKKRLNYDDVFHLSMVVKLSNGVGVMMEKSYRVMIKIMPKNYVMDGERMTISKVSSTFNKMVLNFEDIMRKKGLSPYIYNAITNNCQIFILHLIRGAGINDPQAETFIKQDTDNLLGDKLASVSKVSTDLAGAVGSLLGTGKKMKSEPHVILFDIDKWTTARARAWLKKHNFEPMKRVHKMENNLRYSLTPADYSRYSSKSISDDIVIVFGWR